MTNTQRAEIVKRLDNILSNWGEILDITDQDGIGMSEEFCERYPFEQSFDDLYYSVIEWRDSLDGVGK